MIDQWTNAEGKCVYNGSWKEIDDLEMKRSITHSKPKTENILQLWSKEDKTQAIRCFKKLSITS